MDNAPSPQIFELIDSAQGKGRPVPSCVHHRQLVGYSIEKNRRSMHDDLFDTWEMARDFVNENIDYPMEWFESGKTTDEFVSYKGGHPLLLEKWKDSNGFYWTKEHNEQYDLKSAGVTSAAGSAAMWDIYDITPEVRVIFAHIPNSEYIHHLDHGGYYVEKIREDLWNICKESDSMYGSYISWAPTRNLAIAKAWELRNVNEGKLSRLKKQATKRSFSSVLYASIRKYVLR
jgi:hypothetical protein